MKQSNENEEPFNKETSNKEDLDININSEEFEINFDPSIESIDDIEVTDQYKYILEEIENGLPMVLVMGKAGTGKSTFVRYIRNIIKKNLVVVAPTGVAALNVKGTTIHSYFHFPARLIVDEDIKKARERKLYSKLELLIIDEISMVRADVFDAIDKFLRINGKNKNLPFGGVQLLLIGDLFQLPPVVQKNDRIILEEMGYRSPYFFDAKALKNRHMIPVELKKIYRQTDNDFTGLLNQVRVAENLGSVLPKINSRYNKDEGFKGNSVVTLTSTNARADEINEAELGKLKGESKVFVGETSGNFALDDTRLPSPLYLELKKGAQVMFTKNGEQWVNGTLGEVVSFLWNGIQVKIIAENEKIIDVTKAKWETYSYKFDPIENRIKPYVTGAYQQYPLMLAWGLTIHKAQGKTINKLKLDLGRGAFASGQVYVALSRVRKLEDIYLSQKITRSDVICDPKIKKFFHEISQIQSEYHVEGHVKNKREPPDSLHCPDCGSRLIFKHRNNRFTIKCSNTKCSFKGKIDLQKKRNRR